MIYVRTETRMTNEAATAGAGFRRFTATIGRAGYVGAVAAMAFGLGGCEVFPSGGPNARDVVNRASATAQDRYDLVAVSPEVLGAIAAAPHNIFTGTFADHAPVAAQVIGVGDVVSVTIWDMAGLFASGSSQTASTATIPAAGSAAPNPMQQTSSGATAPGVSIPQQTVDQAGNITVPYAGRIHAAGLTTSGIQDAITSALRKMTYQPQILVTVVQNQSSMVTVAGDIVHPGRLPLPLNGIRILDAIALSGGTNAPSSDMLLRLTRRGVTRTSRLDEVVRYPAENIYLVGDDLVYLDKEPQSVVVLGATNNTAASANLHVLFNKTDLNLAEALGGGGGLTDIQADPYGVFVFRYEPVAIARALGVKRAAAGTPAAFVPVVYQVDMQRPEGFLMAQSFQMEDHDVVYVANSDVVQLGKMFKLFNAIASIPKDNSVVSQ